MHKKIIATEEGALRAFIRRQSMPRKWAEILYRIIAPLARVLKLQPIKRAPQQRKKGLERDLAFFDDAVKRDPLSSIMHYFRGIVLRDLGRLEEARSSLREAVRLDPGYVDARYHLAEVCNALGEAACDEAIENLESVLERKPDFSEAHQLLAMVQQRKGLLTAALASVNLAIDHQPRSAIAHVIRGMVLYQLGEIDLAGGDFARAEALDPALRRLQ